MPWYEGASLLHQLEEVHIASDRNLIDARFPVQYVIRPQDQTTTTCTTTAATPATVAGGVFKPGDEVVVLPSGLTLDRRRHRHGRRPGRRGLRPDVGDDPAGRRRRRQPGRHDRRVRNRPTCGQDIEAMVCWLTGESSLRPGAEAGDQAHDPLGPRRWSRTCSTGSTSTRCTATRPPTELTLNEIGRVQLRTTVPLFFDEYRRNRTTGSFVLVDEATNNTVGAGMILGPTEVSVTAERRTSSGTRAASDRGERPFAGRHRVVHRAVRLGQVDRGGRGRAGGSSPPAGPPTCSTATTCATGSTPTSGSRPPTAPRTSAGSARSPACSPTPAWWRSSRSSAPTGPTATGRGPSTRRSACAFVEVFVDTPLEVCERARPEGPLRQGPGGGDHGVHRHRRPLRGARAPRPAPHAGRRRPRRPGGAGPGAPQLRLDRTVGASRRPGRKVPKHQTLPWGRGPRSHAIRTPGRSAP